MKLIPLLLGFAALAQARPWTDDVIYFVMTDRFHDGDPANNQPPGRDPALFDPQQKDISRYMGGDLRERYHDNAVWADIPEWNAHRTQPDGPRELPGARIATSGVLSRLETYGRKGFSDDSLGKNCGEEIMCDFFSLRDFWTAPDAAHFDELVNEFVEIYHFHMTVVGVDGLRVDTVKHAHHEYWDAFTRRLRERLGPAAADKLMFGEVYDGSPAMLGRYTWRADWPENTGPSLDSVLDFDFCFSAREYLRHSGSQYGSPAALEKALTTREADGPRWPPPSTIPIPGPTASTPGRR